MKSFVHLKKIKILGVLFAFGMLGMALCFLLAGQTPETFHDIIAEALVILKNNKSMELNCFWIIVFVGSFVLLIDMIRTRKKRREEKQPVFSSFSLVLLALATGMVLYYFLTMHVPLFLLTTFFLLLLSHHFLKGKEAKICLINCFLFYFFYGGLSLLNFSFHALFISKEFLLLLSFLITLCLLKLEQKKPILENCILLSQTTIPLILLNYLVDCYQYQGQEIHVPLPFFAKLFFGTLLLSFLVYNFYYLYKNWSRKEKNINQLLSFATIITIFIIHSVSMNTSAILPTDLHHTGENIQAFHQIFSKGQIPYQNYIPVSGLYSVCVGFILELCGGVMMHYNVAVAIYTTIFAILTIVLIHCHLDKKATLLLSLLFLFVNYNRVYLILISLLILLLPKLRAKKNLWLKVWIWLCFLGGLYYPVYGVSVLLGTLPFALYQMISFIRSKDGKSKLHTFRFYLEWFVVLLPIFLAVPILLHLLKHLLVYSSQSLLAEGASVFAQEVPEGLFQIFGGGQFLAKLVYYCLRYMIPALAIWIFVLLLLQFFQDCKHKKDVFKIFAHPKFFLVVSGLLLLLVGYHFTLLRADSGRLLSRTGYLIEIVCGILFFMITVRYERPNPFSAIVLGIMVAILAVLGDSPITFPNYTLQAHYTIEEDYQLIENSPLPRLGTGFVLKEDAYFTVLSKKITFQELNTLSNNAQKLLQYNPDLKFVLYGPLAAYYILDLTTTAQPSIYAIKSQEASEEFLTIIQKEKPVVGTFIANAEQSYYIYHYLMTTDDYLYAEEYEAFLPRELYQKIYGNTVGSDKRLANFTIADLGVSSSVFGNSYEALKTRFTKVQPTMQSICTRQDKLYTCTYTFSKALAKEEVDFLYLEVDTNRDLYNERAFANLLRIDFTNSDIPVKVTWGGEEIKCLLFQGKLLIALGVNSDWLLSDKEKISIQIEGIEPQYQVAISKIEFLKLKTA